MQEKEIQSLDLQKSLWKTYTSIGEGGPPTFKTTYELFFNTHLDQIFLKLLRVSLIVTCECTPDVLIEPLGVAEFGGDPIESLRGGLDFE